MQPLWKSVWKFLQKLKKKIELPYDPAVSLLSMCTENAVHCHRDVCTPIITAALVTIAKTRKQPSPSINE